jgi:hypothetical protein
MTYYDRETDVFKGRTHDLHVIKSSKFRMEKLLILEGVFSGAYGRRVDVGFTTTIESKSAEQE